ncbi:MAG: hypothetical protein ACXWXR_04620 [Candidatus Limnocylindrales bacterium]
MTELAGMGMAAVADEATGLLRVPYEDVTAQQIIARIETPLSVLRVREPSLEEAYVELLRTPGEAVA